MIHNWILKCRLTKTSFIQFEIKADFISIKKYSLEKPKLLNIIFCLHNNSLEFFYRVFQLVSRHTCCEERRKKEAASFFLLLKPTLIRLLMRW
jgi:arsenate reductase-like glutaredoxin family protein